MRFHQIITEKSKPSNPQLWGRAKAEAKKKYKVYPSAYANGYASKKYKEWGGTWTNESTQLDEITRPPTRKDAVQILKSNGYERLGDGEFATVFAKKGNKHEVLKLVDNHDDAYLAYLDMVRQHQDNPHFPKVGKLITITPEYSAVRMEKLSPVQLSDVRGIINDIREYLEDYTTTDTMKDYFGAFPKFKEAMLILRTFMEQQYSDWDWDLHIGNIMFRGNTLVFTDPIYNPSLRGGLITEITRPQMMQDADARLRKAGYKRIGNGLYGAVYQKDKNTVVKTFTSKDMGYLAFINMAKNSNNNPHFPRFYGNPIKVSPDYYAIKQENLRDVPYELSNVYSIRWYIRTKANGGDVSNIGSELKEHFEIFPRLQEACDMIANLIKQNPALYGEDSHIGNIMVRGGTYVFVDPISTILSNDDAKEMPRISSWDTTVEEKPKDTKYKTEWDEIFKQLGNFDEKVEKLDEDLRNWFSEKWVDVSRKDGGKHPECGASSTNTRRKKDSSAAYPKCVPKSKAASMTKKEKEQASRRKRQAQSKAGSKQTFVSTEPKK